MVGKLGCRTVCRENDECWPWKRRRRRKNGIVDRTWEFESFSLHSHSFMHSIHSHATSHIYLFSSTPWKHRPDPTFGTIEWGSFGESYERHVNILWNIWVCKVNPIKNLSYPPAPIHTYYLYIPPIVRYSFSSSIHRWITTNSKNWKQYIFRSVFILFSKIFLTVQHTLTLWHVMGMVILFVRVLQCILY